MTTKTAPKPKKQTPKQSAPPEISLIVPVFNEEESLPHLVRKIQDVMQATGRSWELICVDDGSTDNSAEVMETLQADYPNLKPLYLRRNYGQTVAMQAGFDHAQGSIFVTLDADLQNDPEDIPKLLAHMEKTNADVVSGWRKNRKDSALRKNIPSRIANKFIAWLTHIKLHDLGCALKAYKSDVIRECRIYGELHRFIPIIVSHNGGKIEEIVVQHHARQFGKSKYGLDKTIRVALDILLLEFFRKYLNRPMHAFGYLGLLMFIPGLLIALYLTAVKLTGADIGDRPLLLLAVMLILIGVQLLGMGVLGEMIMRIYHEPEGRKQYVLRQRK